MRFKDNLLNTLRLCALVVFLAGFAHQCQGDELPNIVLVYADDLGFGDVGCYGSVRIPTPNIDRLAAAGLRFTDGHAPAATCTPSRYSLLTGEYAWRRPGTGILPGDAAMIIQPGRTTLASMLHDAGYATGVVGKWHLGLGAGKIDWNGSIQPGPLEVGFDQSFIMAATGDRVPCVFIDGHHIVNLDPQDPITVSYGKPIPGVLTGKDHPELLKMHPSHGHDQSIVNGISRIGYMKGGTAALWTDEEMADVFVSQAVSFIEARQDRRFFLYYATHDPHVPRVPNPRFVGKTDLGPRGDAIVQADWCLGQVLDTLDRLNLSERTLVIFTSDNGPVLDDGYQDEAAERNGDHHPAGPLRGGKYSSFEGGTRVPFIVRWPGKVMPGESAALVSQVDLLASMAALTGQDPEMSEAPDSVNVLPALLGESATGREELVEQARALTLRQSDWKYIEPSRGPQMNRNTNTELGNSPSGLLFNLAADLGETHDLTSELPERVKQMRERLNAIRSAPSE
jgi:arylsulfatase A-like enzyme